ncbi:hypothetical protein [Conexibacter woesei]|uniref:hypothetical protein n=1 Tax=Conexibacter woesei TaxID=191495 RepID=UPI00040968AD|nr:hypothetical protein [Conexibacter woesei]
MLVLWATAAVAVVAPARAGADAAAGAVAANVAVTIQLLWQVQQGCARECVGTSQTQEAAQQATTVQIAAASGDVGSGSVSAQNSSATIQLIVQTQLGCVAFCIGTTRVQIASQRADASQLATAISAGLTASATNTMYFNQLVWQYQDACLRACVDVDARQVVDQAADGVQAAGGDVGTLPPPPADPDLGAFTTWLATVAGAATVDVVQQQDIAACLAHCAGDVQVQISVQQATTAQTSVATSAEPARTDVPDGATATAAATVPTAVAPAAGTAGAQSVAASVATPPARRSGVTRHRRVQHHRRAARAHVRVHVRSAPRSTPHHRRSTGGIHRGT